MSADDFEPLKVIGRGAFGEVDQFLNPRENPHELCCLGSCCTKTRYGTYLCNENSS